MCPETPHSPGSEPPSLTTKAPAPSPLLGEPPFAWQRWTDLTEVQRRSFLSKTTTKCVPHFMLVPAPGVFISSSREVTVPIRGSRVLPSEAGSTHQIPGTAAHPAPFHLPMMVPRLLARLVDLSPGFRIVDPAHGSGLLLLRAAQITRLRGGRDYASLGSKANGDVWSLAGTDMILHRRGRARLERGGKLHGPKLVGCSITNPPFWLCKQDVTSVITSPLRAFTSPFHPTGTRAAAIQDWADLFDTRHRPSPSDTQRVPNGAVTPPSTAAAPSSCPTETQAAVIPVGTDLFDVWHRHPLNDLKHVPDDVVTSPPEASIPPPPPTEAQAIVGPVGTDLLDARQHPLFSDTEHMPDDVVTSPPEASSPPLLTEMPALIRGRTNPLNAKRRKRRNQVPSASNDVALIVPEALARPPLLAEMPDLIRGWTDLSDTKRRDLRSAVSSAMRIDAVPNSRQAPDAPPSPATMTCSYLNTRLFRQAHAIYGIKSRDRFSNILNLLRFILRRIGGHEPRYAGVHTLQAPWRRLHEALPTQHRQTALSGFMRFCSAQSVEPETVTTETLTNFEAWLLERTLCRDAPVRARAVASNWTWARAHVPGWPDVPLKRPRMREQYVRSFEAYPPSLRADAERYLARLAFSDVGEIFPDDVATKADARARRRKALRPRTIAGRSFQLRQCLAAMVIQGRDPATITSLRQLVEPPEQARAIMNFYLDRAGGRRTSQTGAIGEVLRQLARFHCKLEPEAADRIAFWARNAAPGQQVCISEKNRLRLQALLEPHVTNKLLNLPETLMKEAAAPELTPRAAALLALYATALNILIAFPMRRSNLAGLHLDQHLQRLDPKGKLVNYISLSLSETKTDNPMLWPLPARVGALLEAYVKRHRPQLARPGNPYLFPNTKVGPRSAHDLAVGLTELVEGRIGCEFNLQLVRHFVVALHLRHHPGQYDVARKLLGHSATSYTIAVYAPLEVDSAARLLDETLTLERTASHPPPTAPLRRPPGRPPINGRRA